VTSPLIVDHVPWFEDDDGCVADGTVDGVLRVKCPRTPVGIRFRAAPSLDSAPLSGF
jgi:hypothetical protein